MTNLTNIVAGLPKWATSGLNRTDWNDVMKLAFTGTMAAGLVERGCSIEKIESGGFCVSLLDSSVIIRNTLIEALAAAAKEIGEDK